MTTVQDLVLQEQYTSSLGRKWWRCMLCNRLSSFSDKKAPKECPWTHLHGK